MASETGARLKADRAAKKYWNWNMADQSPRGQKKKSRKFTQSGQPELVMAALGGLGEIGMNCYLYGTGPAQARTWMMVDLGITFPEGDFEPGVDVILPDLRFIEEQKIELAGLVITHAHEDHVGALLELWPRINCPVYATPFTIAFIKAKQSEQGNRSKIPFREIAPSGKFKVGPFELEFVAVAHSIPEPQALVIQTAEGRVLHTGDWKLDETPFVGTDTDRARLSALGDAGIDAIVCDSTNALRSGRSPSESDVAASLREIISRAPRAVAATIFASNVSRIKAFADAAEATGRTLVVSGRAMHRMIAVAMETGHLAKSFKYHDQQHYSFLEPSKALVLCTGSQGEGRAAVARIADGQHHDIKLGPGDMMIFSSRTIPGNEKPVGRIQNKLIELGCELITDNDALVHVTGHPRRDELKDMYAWVRPKIAIPMHGEARHMAAHAQLAREAGVPQVMIVRNGDVVKLAPGNAQIIDEIPTGRMFRDGNLIVSGDDTPVRDRRKLATVGIAFITVVLNAKNSLAADPDVILDGVPMVDREGRDMVDIALDAVDQTLKSMPPQRRRDLDVIEDAVAKAVRSSIDRAWGKKPIVKCIVTRVDGKA
jgi:ribonuclease J